MKTITAVDKKGHHRLLQIFIKPAPPNGLSSRLSRSGSLASLSMLPEDPIMPVIREAAYALQTAYEHCLEVPGILQASVIDLPEAVLVERPFLHASLAAALKHGQLASEERHWIGLQLISAVAQLHDLGQFHGDLRPANLLLTSYGRVFLADLAPFKPYRMPEDDSCLFEYFYNEGGAEKSYLAPERLVHCEVQEGCEWAQGNLQEWQQADLYGLGLVLAELQVEEALYASLLLPYPQRRLPDIDLLEFKDILKLPLYTKQPDVDEAHWQETLLELIEFKGVSWIALQMAQSASMRPEVDPLMAIELMARFWEGLPEEMLHARLLPHLIRLADHQWTPVRLAALQLLQRIVGIVQLPQKCVKAYLIPSLVSLTQSGVMAVRLATIQVLLGLCREDCAGLLNRLVMEWLSGESAPQVKTMLLGQLLPQVAIQCASAADLVPRAAALLNEAPYFSAAKRALLAIADAGIMQNEITVILGGISSPSIETDLLVPQIPITAKDLGAIPVPAGKERKRPTARPSFANQGWVPRGNQIGRFGSLVTDLLILNEVVLATGHSDGSISLWLAACLQNPLFTYKLEHGPIVSLSGNGFSEHVELLAVTRKAIVQVKLSLSPSMTVNSAEETIVIAADDILDGREGCTVYANGRIQGKGWEVCLGVRIDTVLWAESWLLAWDDQQTLHLVDRRFGVEAKSWPFAFRPLGLLQEGQQPPMIFAGLQAGGMGLFPLFQSDPVAKYQSKVEFHDLTLSWLSAPWAVAIGADGQLRIWSGYRQDVGSLARSSVLGEPKRRVRMEIQAKIPVSVEENNSAQTSQLNLGRYSIRIMHLAKASLLLLIDPLGHVCLFS